MKASRCAKSIRRWDDFSIRGGRKYRAWTSALRPLHAWAKPPPISKHLPPRLYDTTKRFDVINDIETGNDGRTIRTAMTTKAALSKVNIRPRPVADNDTRRSVWPKTTARKRRIASHGQLANQFIAHGVVYKTEKLSYRAFQQRWGRSISIRAPRLFLSLLTRKAERAGGQVIEFNTRTTA